MNKGNRYKIWLLAVGMLAMIVVTGCGGSQPAAGTGGAASQSGPVSGLKEAIFEQPILITSVGQSADGQMVKALAERNNLQFTYDPLIKPEAVSQHKTLLLVVGGSSKGLGAAGINAAQEEQRAKDLIAKAKDSKVKILVAHVGGESRRGEMTDKFVTVVAPQADYLIVVADGDNDKIFAKIAGSKIPLDYPKSIVEVGGFLKKAVK